MFRAAETSCSKPWSSRIIPAVSEAALTAAMAEMAAGGVSTRKVSKVMETLCGTSYLKSAVFEVCSELDAQVEEFKGRTAAVLPAVGYMPRAMNLGTGPGRMPESEFTHNFGLGSGSHLKM